MRCFDTAIRLSTTLSVLLATTAPLAAVHAEAASTKAEQAQAPLPPCSEKSFRPSPGVTITSVREVASPTPYCRVEGQVVTNHPGPNTVAFSLALPPKWNGRYVMVIPGGAAGFVPEPSAVDLQNGFAVAATDKGSHTTGLDLSFRNSPARFADYAHRGVAVTSLATQQLTAQFYSKPHFPRYMIGCSAGGIAVLAAAIFHPELAEGFVAGSGSVTGGSMLMWGYISQYVAQDPERWISPQQLQQVSDTLLARFDADDGAKDGLLWDGRNIVLSAADFPYLTPKQFGTLKLLQSGLPGLKEAPGIAAPGYWLTHVTSLSAVLGPTPPPWTSGHVPMMVQGMASWEKTFRGNDFDYLTQLDFKDPTMMRKEQSELRRQPGWFGGITPDGMAKAVGLKRKLVLYVSSGDEASAPAELLAFNDALHARFGQQAADGFVRTYIVPGMSHCRANDGGPTDSDTRFLEATTRWVERGAAPGEVIVSNADAPALRGLPGGMQLPPQFTKAPAGPRRTFKLCPYPSRSVFKGGKDNGAGLDTNDANNWTCSP